ncbi:2-keto-myo-inositol dehydratase [Marinitoga hydrogenitolerans DSM 16785]|uniref:2-keto-myo-inositol dehydratase n=1 Tax=Marinitoga hydrogenitolerans (strain DSM 16785 / JCM 12826 / AT1271) TaxID=1122195 RepID=A0A1M4SHZ4_MARH1|nr:myo-inosose-2 dehydratase [Marinitoga hydrogenitolerans]SHE31884.1 2-keto-myo-inositol dehydratase [Marinitoga hydrogenitolerans DSM 16785]
MLKKDDIKIGIAPIAWTNDDMPELGGDISFEQCIDEMQKAGYEGTEIGNKYPKDPIKLKSELEKRNLKVASQWFSTFFTVDKFDKTIEDFKKHMNFLKAVGAEVIVVAECGKSIHGNINIPLHKNKPVFNDEEWNKLAKGLNILGNLAKEKNMKIVYHHHMGTGVQTYEEIIKLMELTDPTKVFLLLDTGHIVFSNGDPLKLIEKYPDRIKHIHLKDLRKDILEKTYKEDLSFLNAVKEGVFTVPGDGMIDFKPIFNSLNKIDYKGWLIVEAEQDPKKAPPLKFALKARNYIKNLIGF